MKKQLTKKEIRVLRDIREGDFVIPVDEADRLIDVDLIYINSTGYKLTTEGERYL
jgi:3,4-dihydroxy-2-butanone 4-phosphate synthase